MKKYLFLGLFALLCTFSIAAQDTLANQVQLVSPDQLNEIVYKVWIDDAHLKGRYLWAVTDSTITLGTSRYSPEKGKETIPVDQIGWIKTRKKDKLALGMTVGTGIAAIFGFGAGHSRGDDPPCQGILCFSFTAGEKGKFMAALLAPVGLAVGGILGCLKAKTTINGSRSNLAAERQKLKKYERRK